MGFRNNRAVCEADFQWVYEKTDSTPRGNIAAGINAQSEAFQSSLVLYVTAYPKSSEVSIRQIQHVGDRGCGTRNYRSTAGKAEKPSWLILKQRISMCSPVDFARILAQTVRGISRDKKFGAVVCMCQDQARMLSKLLGFVGGVNITLGLPIVRTSGGHGTAFDIAG